MGIKQLMSLIQEKAPKAIKHIQLELLTGKIVACDASMAIYQFLIATQGFSKEGQMFEMRDSEGNLTGHLVGLFNRTIQFMENGIKPIWVFDGKPPELKDHVLDQRKELKANAEEIKEKAIEAGDLETAKKMMGRSIKVTQEMMNDAKKLIQLMGIPVIESPGEAEAQCAAIVKHGLAFATASEDMDSLTFGTNFLLRGFNSKKEPIIQIELAQVLEGFGMNHDEFVDLCILCGCDYTTNIPGIGPITAFKYVEECRNIEAIIEKIEKENENPNKKRKQIPENFRYQQSRELFKAPSVENNKDVLEA
jgi:flap endonuclease-1